MSLFFNHPERIQAIITQNGNAYIEGLGGFWADTMEPSWKKRNPPTEKKVRALLTLKSTKYQYSVGIKDPEGLNPDSYTFDQMTLDRPGNAGIQPALIYDYQNNVALHPKWHDILRNVKPPVLAVWGKKIPSSFPQARRHSSATSRMRKFTLSTRGTSPWKNKPARSQTAFCVSWGPAPVEVGDESPSDRQLHRHRWPQIAYREAGRPKMVLLHGFPSSSHQHRDLIRSLPHGDLSASLDGVNVTWAVREFMAGHLTQPAGDDRLPSGPSP
jgi:hypothetical protein